MTWRFDDRVKVTTSAPGTGAFPYNSAAVTGFNPFTSIPSIVNGDTVPYAAWDGAGNWETGYITYSTATNMARTVKRNSAGNTSAINFTGAVTVWCSGANAAFAVIMDPSNNLNIPGVLIGKAYGSFFGLLQNADQSVSSGVWAKCNLDTINTDQAAGWSASNNWWVCPKTGLWSIAASIRFSGSSISVAQSQISKNGTNNISLGRGELTTSLGANSVVPIPAVIASLAAGDTIELDGNVTGTGVAFVSSSAIYTYMSIQWLGTP